MLNDFESKSADDVIDGVSGLDCKVGMGSAILTDQDNGTLEASDKMEVKEIDLVLFEENKIRLKTCPMSGHNTNRLAEQEIGPVSKSLEYTGILKMKL